MTQKLNVFIIGDSAFKHKNNRIVIVFIYILTINREDMMKLVALLLIVFAAERGI